MKRILLIASISLNILVAVFLTYRLIHTFSTDLSRCKGLYADNPYLNDNNPELQDVLSKEGLDTVDQLITRRCETWIKNGQKF